MRNMKKMMLRHIIFMLLKTNHSEESLRMKADYIQRNANQGTLVSSLGIVQMRRQ